MTIALVILSVITTGSLATIGALVVYLMRAVADEKQMMQSALFAGKAQIAAEEEARKIAAERDELIERVAAAQLNEAKATRAFASLQMQINSVIEENTEHVVTAIRSAPDAARASALLRDVLSTTVPGMPAADRNAADEATASTGGDEAAAAAVRAAELAGETGFGRGTGW